MTTSAPTKKRSTKKDTTPDLPQLEAPAKPLEAPPDQIDVEPTPEPTPEPFMPFCQVLGVFDPSEKSECCMVCKPDNEDAFAACLLNHTSKPAKKVRSSVPRTTTGLSRANKSFWGHVMGTQAGRIDECVTHAIIPMQLHDITEFALTDKMARVLAHLKHVHENRMKDFAPGEEILYDEDGGIFYSGNEAASKAAIGNITPITAYFINKYYKTQMVRK